MVISCCTCQKEEKECTRVQYLIYAVLSQLQICHNLCFSSGKSEFPKLQIAQKKKLQCSVLHCTAAVHCTALLQYGALYCSKPLYCTLAKCASQLCTALHYITQYTPSLYFNITYSPALKLTLPYSPSLHTLHSTPMHYTTLKCTLLH